MKRFVFASSLALLVLAGGLACAQDGAKPAKGTETPPPAKGTEAPAPAKGTEAPAPAPAAGPALRVSLDLSSQLDGVTPARNDFLYFAWERLTYFGLRAEVAKPIGDPKLDRYVEGKAAKWEAQQPGAAPAALLIVGTAPAEYADAQFYGQGQSHTFNGSVDVELKKDGASVVHIAYTHNWGRLPADKTKSQTQQEYEQMVYTTAVVALLSRPELQAGVPEAKKAELTSWLAEQKKKLRKPLEGTSLENGELATILKNLPGAPAAPAKE